MYLNFPTSPTFKPLDLPEPQPAISTSSLPYLAPLYPPKLPPLIPPIHQNLIMDLSFPIPQGQSPLFSILPAEIRSEIFTYALTDYDDEAFNPHTFWYRPDFTSSRKTATELLRACKRIYLETWFMPFTLTEHTFFLGGEDRAPNPTTTESYTERLQALPKTHEDFNIHRIRFFAQLCALEPGRDMQEVFDMPCFRPKHVTLTIRYTDFWYWEHNQKLYIDSRWVNEVRFPDSVTSFTMEMEMIDRRKEEVNILAERAVESWFFQRKDGALLAPRKDQMSVLRWTGSSVLGGRRWLRDETQPGKLDYHVVRVTWRSSSSSVSELGMETPCRKLVLPDDFRQVVPSLQGWASLRDVDLRLAGVSLNTPAEEAVEQYRAANSGGQRRPRARSIGFLRRSRG